MLNELSKKYTVIYFKPHPRNSNELIDKILKLNYKIGPRRGGDIEKIFAETTKVNDVLGWTAQYDIKDMMQHAWAWQQGLGE